MVVKLDVAISLTGSDLPACSAENSHLVSRCYAYSDAGDNDV